MEKAIFELGKSSIKFPLPVWIRASYSVAGTKEAEGPLKDYIHETLTDDKEGMKSWEEAESKLQARAIEGLLKSQNLKSEQVRYLFAGDLLGQCIASSFGTMKFQIPYFGVYGACSTCAETLTLGAMAIAGGFASRVIAVTSSHFASAEKEFRLPLEYGGQRPKSATRTVTGSGAFLLTDTTSDEKPLAKISGVTTGTIVDMGIKDSMNMGCAMAPAAAQVILQHFEDFQTGPQDYDRIVTGDLGLVGSQALLDLLSQKGVDISQNHRDCGMWIYNLHTQKVDAGGSGCGCCAVTLAAYILRKLEKREYKRVLFVPTGALLSKTSFQEGKSVPGIAHAIVLECF